ncbi:MAG TPA: hypothetical protein VG603_13250 [Chitinophagales bacterium]|nr:hypothetical protein [Chitinophagales bacterium]
MDFLIIRDESENGFRAIAQKLFDEYAIQTCNGLYGFAELEFYWNNLSTHNDKATYERKYVNPKRGDWFFHYSGVDIALKNDDAGFGGILIRGIIDITNRNKIYKGPLVCVMRLFSEANAFSSSMTPQIVPYDKFEKSKIESKPRIGLGKNAIESNTDKLNYNFSIYPSK